MSGGGFDMERARRQRRGVLQWIRSGAPESEMMRVLGEELRPGHVLCHGRCHGCGGDCVGQVPVDQPRSGRALVFWCGITCPAMHE